MTVAVVGAGIIGAAIAVELRRRGRDVLLIDRGAPGRGASYGNMASIAVTEFLPSSRPGIWAQIPGWLFDPEGPVRVRPGYLLEAMPWFLRFLMAGTPARVRALEAAGAALCGRVYEDLLPLLDAAGLGDMLSAEGCLSLYADDREFAADRDHLALLERFALPHEVLGPDRLRALEPEISAGIRRAVLFPRNRSVRDPHRLVVALVERFEAMGGGFATGEVVGFDRDDGLTALRLADGRQIGATAAILCGGAHTGALARMLGEPIPLETERGYHTQIMAPGIALRHSLIWPARAFMVTPTAGGIRVGGTVEMAGLDAPPDYRRARALVDRARVALPGLQARDTSEWMGHRPALPDTVPIIGPSSTTRGVYYATGHGHLGLTQAATTARLIGDLVTGVAPPLDMTPYRIDRF